MDRQHHDALAAICDGRFLRPRGEAAAPRVTEGAPSLGENHGDHALEDLSQSLDEMVSEFLGAEAPEELDPGARDGRRRRGRARSPRSLAGAGDAGGAGASAAPR